MSREEIKVEGKWEGGEWRGEEKKEEGTGEVEE